MHYFDLYHGVELTPNAGDQVALTFSIGAKDYGAVLATKSPLKETERAPGDHEEADSSAAFQPVRPPNHSAATTGRGRFDETSVGDSAGW